MELCTQTQTIHDPAEWDGSLFGTQLELVQLRGVEFHSSQMVTQLQGVQLLRLTVNQAITVRSRPLTLRYVAALFDRAHEGHFAGAPMDSGKLLIMPPAFDFDGCVKDSAFCCSVIFAVPEQVESYYQTLVGEKISEIDSLIVASPDPGETQWLRAWFDLVAPENPESLTANQKASVQESLRDKALTLLVKSLQSSVPSEVTDNVVRLSKARRLVRIAEDYANSNPDKNIRMVDLCRVTEVSERTLQYAFKTCLGISPINYLKRHRLHRVRRELKAANSSESTVSAIACQFGFFHFGEFAQAYKSQFDETPSRTLKQC